MVVLQIAKEGARMAIKLSKYDKRAWDKLYFGIRKDIKLGIKHGFGAGSILGTFINDESNPFIEDAPPLQQRNGSKANKFSKGNRRFGSTRGYGRNFKYCRVRPKCK